MWKMLRQLFGFARYTRPVPKPIRTQYPLCVELLEDRCVLDGRFSPTATIEHLFVADQALIPGDIALGARERIVIKPDDRFAAARLFELQYIPAQDDGGFTDLNINSVQLYQDLNRNGRIDSADPFVPTRSFVGMDEILHVQTIERHRPLIRANESPNFLVSMGMTNSLQGVSLGLQFYDADLRMLTGRHVDVMDLGGSAPAIHTFSSLAEPQITVVQRGTGTADTIVKNAKNQNLLRFDVRAESQDLLFTSAQFVASQGHLSNALNYTLWADFDGDLHVDTIIQKGVSAQNGKILFSPGGGFIIPQGTDARFEVHADIAASLMSDTLQLAFDTAASNYIQAEDFVRGDSLVGIQTNGVGEGQIAVITTPAIVHTIKNQGSLFIERDTTPVPERQLLLGGLSDTVLSLQLTAMDEAIDVTKLRFNSVGGLAKSVDRIELYKEGTFTPFATATIGATATDIVPTTYAGQPTSSFTARMQSQQLVIPAGQSVRIYLRVRMKSDVDGGIPGEHIQFTVMSTPVVNTTTGEGAVHARGLSSSNNLLANNGNGIADGEIFIGSGLPVNNTQNSDVLSVPNVTVGSKITEIANANPDPNGTSVPVGVSDFAQFKFSASPNTNSKNGLNTSTLSGLIVTVNATNVEFDASSFQIYNKANSSISAIGMAYNSDGMLITGRATGTFYLVFSLLELSPVNTQIDQGGSLTLAIRGTITNRQISSSQGSILQASLQNFTDQEETLFGFGESHVQWFDEDFGKRTHYSWIEYPEEVIKSTMYQL